MKKTPVIFAATVFFVSTAAFAAGPDFASVDADKDGKVTFTELAAVMPDASENKFKAADGDGDGALSEQEFEVFAKM